MTENFAHNVLTFFFWWAFIGALVWWMRETTGMTEIVVEARRRAGKPMSLPKACAGTCFAIMLWPWLLSWFWTHRDKAWPMIRRNLWGRG